MSVFCNSNNMYTLLSTAVALHLILLIYCNILSLRQILFQIIFAHFTIFQGGEYW